MSRRTLLLLLISVIALAAYALLDGKQRGRVGHGHLENEIGLDLRAADIRSIGIQRQNQKEIRLVREHNGSFWLILPAHKTRRKPRRLPADQAAVSELFGDLERLECQRRLPQEAHGGKWGLSPADILVKINRCADASPKGQVREGAKSCIIQIGFGAKDLSSLGIYLDTGPIRCVATASAAIIAMVDGNIRYFRRERIITDRVSEVFSLIFKTTTGDEIKVVRDGRTWRIPYRKSWLRADIDQVERLLDHLANAQATYLAPQDLSHHKSIKADESVAPNTSAKLNTDDGSGDDGQLDYLSLTGPRESISLTLRGPCLSIRNALEWSWKIGTQAFVICLNKDSLPNVPRSLASLVDRNPLRLPYAQLARFSIKYQRPIVSEGIQLPAGATYHAQREGLRWKGVFRHGNKSIPPPDSPTEDAIRHWMTKLNNLEGRVDLDHATDSPTWKAKKVITLVTESGASERLNLGDSIGDRRPLLRNDEPATIWITSSKLDFDPLL